MLHAVTVCYEGYVLGESLGARHAVAETLLIHGVAARFVGQVGDLFRQVCNPFQSCGGHSVTMQQYWVAYLQEDIQRAVELTWIGSH